MGAGKSTVARLLGARGAQVVDADAIAREVVEPGEPALVAIGERFGDGVIGDDGRLDRAALAALVFADDDLRHALEDITHPAIRARIRERIDEHAEGELDGEQRVVVLDHPLLVETGLAASLEQVVVVTAPVDVRVARLAAGRGIDPADARARIATQADDEQRLAAATQVVDNAGDLAALEQRVAEVWQELTG
jgi:dephospho-CoA kinase